MHKKDVVDAGISLEQADKAVIMLHGRGAAAEDILTLSQYLDLRGFAVIAPQAAGNSWYPYSFLAPPEQNEPYLTSALNLIAEVAKDVEAEGIKQEQTYFLGFSQGACLTLEYAARNARRYGGIAAFTGGLIGNKIYMENYKGDFNGTPVFIGTSDPDPHVPLERVNESADLLRKMNATVTLKVYKNMGHTITLDEIESAQELIFGK